MRIVLSLVLALIVLLAGCETEIAHRDDYEDMLVVGYLLTGNTNRVDAKMAEQLTDIIYFSVEPAVDGSVDSSRIRQSDCEQRYPLNSLLLRHTSRWVS